MVEGGVTGVGIIELRQQFDGRDCPQTAGTEPHAQPRPLAYSHTDGTGPHTVVVVGEESSLEWLVPGRVGRGGRSQTSCTEQEAQTERSLGHASGQSGTAGVQLDAQSRFVVPVGAECPRPLA